MPASLWFNWVLGFIWCIFRHLPYNVTPAYLKAKTDAAMTLLKEIKGIKMDENKMKPREVKVLEQVGDEIDIVEV